MGSTSNIHNFPLRIYKSNNRKYRYVIQTLVGDYREQNPGALLVAGFNHPRNTEQDYGNRDPLSRSS